MKFIHLSDLHLGKRVNDFSMLEDQEHILKEILGIIDEEKPDGVIIAGDVYDKSVPNEKAVELLDFFLTSLAKRNLQTFIISGNHDSAVKLAFASGLIDASGIHISPAYNGEIKPFELIDKLGRVNIYMLPFVKPVNVKDIFPEEEIKDYTDACRVCIEKMNINPEERNILIAHQFVTGAERSESEEVSVGGLDNVSAEIFDDFDYVALGHIHGPQSIGKETIRYCGTPLKYSFSEEKHKKSVTIVEIGDKNDVTVNTRELKPKRDMRTLKGTFDELVYKPKCEGPITYDYIHAVLTDEEDVVDAMTKLRVKYPNIMKLTYDNKRTRENRLITGAAEQEKKTPIQLFEEFYEMQNNQEMTDVQKEFVASLIDEIWGENK